jgi:hypothetical protein
MFSLNHSSLIAQINTLIQFSGTTYAAGKDTMVPVGFALVKNLSRNAASYSNQTGFFSLVVERGDTLEYSSVGFKTERYIVPQNITGSKFKAMVMMRRDTHFLPEAIIVPWKNVTEFKKAFIDLKLNEDDIVRAYQNLQMDHWDEISKTVSYDGQANNRYTLGTQNANTNADKGGMNATNNLANPFAWMQFIQSLQKKKAPKNPDAYKSDE